MALIVPKRPDEGWLNWVRNSSAAFKPWVVSVFTPNEPTRTDTHTKNSLVIAK